MRYILIRLICLIVFFFYILVQLLSLSFSFNSNDEVTLSVWSLLCKKHLLEFILDYCQHDLLNTTITCSENNSDSTDSFTSSSVDSYVLSLLLKLTHRSDKNEDHVISKYLTNQFSLLEWIEEAIQTLVIIEQPVNCRTTINIKWITAGFGRLHRLSWIEALVLLLGSLSNHVKFFDGERLLMSNDEREAIGTSDRKMDTTAREDMDVEGDQAESQWNRSVNHSKDWVKNSPSNFHQKTIQRLLSRAVFLMQQEKRELEEFVDESKRGMIDTKVYEFYVIWIQRLETLLKYLI